MHVLPFKAVCHKLLSRLLCPWTLFTDARTTPHAERYLYGSCCLHGKSLCTAYMLQSHTYNMLLHLSSSTTNSGADGHPHVCGCFLDGVLLVQSERGQKEISAARVREVEAQLTGAQTSLKSERLLLQQASHTPYCCTRVPLLLQPCRCTIAPSQDVNCWCSQQSRF